MTLPTTSGVRSALEKRVQRWSADLREPRDLGLRHSGRERLRGQLADRGRLLPRLRLRRCATPAVSGKGLAYLIVHDNNFTRMSLTSPPDARKVLYMETTQTITIGTTVSYEDMANPLCKGIVADIETSRWGTQYVIAWNGYRSGEISTSDCRQHGWRVIA